MPVEFLSGVVPPLAPTTATRGHQSMSFPAYGSMPSQQAYGYYPPYYGYYQQRETTNPAQAPAAQAPTGQTAVAPKEPKGWDAINTGSGIANAASTSEAMNLHAHRNTGSRSDYYYSDGSSLAYNPSNRSYNAAFAGNLLEQEYIKDPTGNKIFAQMIAPETSLAESRGIASRMKTLVPPDGKIPQAVVDQAEMLHQTKKRINLLEPDTNKVILDLEIEQMKRAEQTPETAARLQHLQSERQQVMKQLVPEKTPRTSAGVAIYQATDEAREALAKHRQLQRQLVGHQMDLKDFKANPDVDRKVVSNSQHRLEKLQNDVRQSKANLTQHYTPKYKEIIENRKIYHEALKERNAYFRPYEQDLTDWQTSRQALQGRRDVFKSLNSQDANAQLAAVRKELAENAKAKPQPPAYAGQNLDELAKKAQLPGQQLTPLGQLQKLSRQSDETITNWFRNQHVKNLSSSNGLVRNSAKLADGFETTMGNVFGGALNRIPNNLRPLALHGVKNLGFIIEGGRAVYNLAKGNYKNMGLDLVGAATGFGTILAIAPGLIATGGLGFGAMLAAGLITAAGAWVGRKFVGQPLVNALGLTNKDERQAADLDAFAKANGINRLSDQQKELLMKKMEALQAQGAA